MSGGFLSLLNPDLPGTFALHDMTLALRFIHANAASFGGVRTNQYCSNSASIARSAPARVTPAGAPEVVVVGEVVLSVVDVGEVVGASVLGSSVVTTGASVVTTGSTGASVCTSTGAVVVSSTIRAPVVVV
ncbi:hypothetical protein PRIPAC_73167 [Pristionchus pacificus]|uniref:Esterase n=1 Tax=Pristionchus pacificus TaxID=54126 RepID=A0A2A6CF18_PRIPA|nr:hypothetical protein PRIPAC_73167 [Pristionchus pacificus]|eukprot:PDM76653.1 esterase [Pristionchus pacificus]